MAGTALRGSIICMRNMANADLDTFYISRLDKKDIVRFNVSLWFFILATLVLALVNFSDTAIGSVFLICSISAFFWGRSFRKKFREMEVRGNMLIIPDGKNSTVTSFKSIKKIRTKRLLNRKLTFVDYHLDGKMQSVILISPIHQSPGTMLTELKKKKADL